MPFKLGRLTSGLVAICLLGAGVAWAALPPGGTFTDDNGNIFEGAIEAIAAEGITQGCNPPANTRFCPNDFVTRGEMAVFLVRALHLTDNGGNLFVDDDGLFYENSADRLKAAGITLGCNPPTNDRYCGERNVTRGEMAAFLVRAFGYSDFGDGNYFIDDNGNIFENAIDKLRVAGVTQGCNPPTNNKFCPNDNVTRGQMAAFLTRAVGLTPITPPPPTSSTLTTTTLPTTTSTGPAHGSVFWSCNNATYSWSCSGNTDTSDVFSESWTCNNGTYSFSCSGNVDKTDVFSESWTCNTGTYSWSCSGNVDKTDVFSESWTCNTGTYSWSCSGNVDKTDVFSESWSCNKGTYSYSCSGNVDKTDVFSESWSCNVSTYSWSCSGNVGRLAPIVDSVPT